MSDSENAQNKLKTFLVKSGVEVNGTIDEFYDDVESFRGLWVSLETGILASFDFYEFDFFDKSELNQTISKMGYYLELYDGGTGFICEE